MHTTGPWFEHNKLTHVEVVTDEHGSTVIAEVYGEANAHLIAAAPALLDALERINSMICDVVAGRAEYSHADILGVAINAIDSAKEESTSNRKIYLRKSP